MSALQKGFSIGTIVTGLIMTVMLGVFSWVGNQTLENSQDKERLEAMLQAQMKQTDRLVRSLDRLNDTIVEISKSVLINRGDIRRIEEHIRVREKSNGR